MSFICCCECANVCASPARPWAPLLPHTIHIRACTSCTRMQASRIRKDIYLVRHMSFLAKWLDTSHYNISRPPHTEGHLGACPCPPFWQNDSTRDANTHPTLLRGMMKRLIEFISKKVRRERGAGKSSGAGAEVEKNQTQTPASGSGTGGVGGWVIATDRHISQGNKKRGANLSGRGG